MEPFDSPRNVSYDRLEVYPISPGRRKSRNYNNNISPISPEFFEKREEGSKESLTTLFQDATKLTSEKSPGRARSYQVFDIENPMISSKKSLSIESQKSPLTSTEKTKKIISSPNDSLEKNPLSNPQTKNDQIPAKNRTSQGQLKFRESLENLRKIRSAISHAETSEEKTKLVRSEIENSLIPLSTASNSEKFMHLHALKKTGLPHNSPDGNRLVSFELGKAILRLKNMEGVKSLVEKYMREGITNPKVCGEEMWRSMGCTKIYNSKSDLPILDGTKICSEESERDKDSSNHMGKTLNLLFQHLTKSDDELIPAEDFGSSQEEAGIIGMTLSERLEAKENAIGLDKALSMKMQLMLGLGKQELYTLPATWAIPEEYHTVTGKDELIISEFGPTVGEIMKPLQYDREISLKMREDGGLDYIVDQPITFKERQSKELLGTCRIQTTFIFDQDMNCISLKQEIRAASILDGEL